MTNQAKNTQTTKIRGGETGIIKTDPEEIEEITENTNLNKSDNLDQKDQFLKKLKLNFPGGPAVKNPPAKAGDVRSIGKTPHHGQLSPCATTTEAVLWSPCVLEELEIAHMQQQRITKPHK